MKIKNHSNVIRWCYFIFLLLMLSFLSIACISDEFDCWLNSDNCIEPSGNQMPSLDREITYKGTAKTSLRAANMCDQTGDVVIVLKPGNTFTMKITKPDIDVSNCNQLSDMTITTLTGIVDDKNMRLKVMKCPFNDMPPDSNINYNQKAASGTITCYDTKIGGGTESFLTVAFDAKIVIP